MLLAVLEQLQVPLAQVREHLGIGGMDPVTAANFRDKDRMKTVFEQAASPAPGTSWPSAPLTPSNLPNEWVSPSSSSPPRAPGRRARSASTTRVT